MSAKLILQNLCLQQLGWDDEILNEDTVKWEHRVKSLSCLTKLNIPRFLLQQECSYDFVKSTQIHHFSDASPGAYEVVTFLRFVCENDNVICSFILSKARLTPLKTISIPRLELTAAMLAVQIDQMLQRELTLPNRRAIFWTDSTAVFQMISNTNKRFSVFVANRLIRIEERTSAD